MAYSISSPLRVDGDTFSISATQAASAAVALPIDTGKPWISLRIVNEGPSIAFIACGVDNTVAATLPTGTPGYTSTPVLPGTDVSFTFDPQIHKYISTICRAAGTATLSVSVVEGV